MHTRRALSSCGIVGRGDNLVPPTRQLQFGPNTRHTATHLPRLLLSINQKTKMCGEQAGIGTQGLSTTCLSSPALFLTSVYKNINGFLPDQPVQPLPSPVLICQPKLIESQTLVSSQHNLQKVKRLQESSTGTAAAHLQVGHLQDEVQTPREEKDQEIPCFLF